jgi:ribosome biogenesis GTPase
MQRHARPKPDAALVPGLVVAAYGRHFAVELADGTAVPCTTRGRRCSLACGDRVAIVRTSADQGVIEAVDPRSTVLFRSDSVRHKLLAANVTQVVVVVAPWPVFSEDLLIRCLVAAEHTGAQGLIVLNKIDLPGAATALEQLTHYPSLGYGLLAMSAKRDVAPLRAWLEGHTSVLVGESGMGKSTIVNCLAPAARAATAEVSQSLATGKHTTTHTRLYHLNPRTAIVDAPGIQLFGLHHIDPPDLGRAFPEFRPWLGQCRFSDCRHLYEPECAISRAAQRGTISDRRLQAYRRLLQETLRR